MERRQNHDLVLALAALLVFACWVTPAAAIDKTPGVVVEDISPDSVAVRAGLRIADRILAYDARVLMSPADLEAAQQNTFGKQKISLQVVRGEEPLQLSVPAGAIGAQVRPNFPPGITSLYQLGKAALQAGRKQEAVSKWEEAAEESHREANDTAAAWLYLNAARVNESLQQTKADLADCVRAWELLKESKDAPAQSKSLLALGRYNELQSDYPAAEKWFKQAQEVDDAAGNEMWVAADISRIGNLYYYRGDLPAGQEYYLRALAIRERIAPESLEVASSLNDLGNVADDRGELEESRKLHLRALAIRERLAPDSLAVAGSLNNLGIVVMELGDFQAADQYYRRGLQIKERLLPDSLDVANTLNNLGNVAMNRGDLTASHGYHSRALAIRSRLAQDSLDVSASLSNLADIARKRGDLSAARVYNTRALAIRERLAPNSILITQSLGNLGLLAAAAEDFQLAVDYQTRALQIQEKLAPDSLIVASTLINLGEIALARNDLAAAADYHKRALEIQERVAPDAFDVSNSLSGLGRVDFARRDFRSAHLYQSRALSIRERLAPDSVEMAETLTDLGKVAFQEGRLRDAQPLFERAVAVVESQRSQIPSAEARAFLVAKHIEPYAELVRTQVTLHQLPAAFATSERAHARSLLDLLKEAHADIRRGVDVALLERERSLQQLLNAKAEQQTRLLNRKHSEEEAANGARELDGITSSYNQVEAEIRTKNPQYAALTQLQPLTLTEIQDQVLDPRTLLLEYSLGEDASYLFAVTQGLIKVYELPKRTELEAAARGVYGCLAARNQHKVGETADRRRARIARADAECPQSISRLGKLLIAPAAAELESKRLLVVADGALLQVPFAVLVDPVGAGSQPLIMAHEVVSVPSASVLAVHREQTFHRAAGRLSLALFADPVFEQDDPRVKELAGRRSSTGGPPTTATGMQQADSSIASPNGDAPLELDRATGEAGILDGGSKIRRLPFSRVEADAIFAFVPRGTGLKALDFDASRNAVTRPDLDQYRIVHFATHALINSDHPELSGILLSLMNREGQKIDGFLRLNEIYNLKLPADLVVLSACQTALGKEIQGEGLIGLMRGFMYAGAERVIASLWKVDDEATAELMGRFYEKMLKRRQPSAAALRQAQVEMSRQSRWRAPYFWAGFAIYGEWK